MNIKAMNDFVIVEQATTSAGSIIMKENNTGIVISCSIEPDLVGRQLSFLLRKQLMNTMATSLFR
mgnify:CR=1 FL=1